MTSAAYSSFAASYDAFTAHVAYAAWAGHLRERVRLHTGRVPNEVLDLGCGTGRLSMELAHGACRLVGLDRSVEMLALAAERFGGGKRATFKQGRLDRPLPFPDARFAWIVCTHDSLNYAASLSRLTLHFQEVGRVLSAGGLYSTDVVVPDPRRPGVQVTERRVGRGLRISRESNYDLERRLLTSMVYLLDASGSVQWEEEHRQRLHSRAEVLSAAAEAGLELVEEGAEYRSRPIRSGDRTANYHFRKAGG